MKKYQKNESPAVYQKWFNENNERLQESDLDGRAIFDKVTDYLKPKLGNSLMQEQGYICAYCGKRIGRLKGTTETGELITFSVDHFESIFCNRTLALDYTNLIGTCKMGNHKSKIVDLATIKTLPKTFRNIANELDVDLNDFTGKGKIKDDDDLEEWGIEKVKYRDIPTHCDDSKEIRLAQIGWECGELLENYIVNPSKIDNCDLFFTFQHDGKMDINPNNSTINQQKARNSVVVFNLDNKYLRDKRADAYLRGERLLNEFRQQATIEGREFSIDEIEQTIFEDIYSFDNEGKLDPYCFVTAHVLRQILE